MHQACYPHTSLVNQTLRQMPGPRSDQHHSGAMIGREKTMAESPKDPMIPDGKVNPIDTDYKIGQDNVALKIGPFGLDFHNRVFVISATLIVAFVLLTISFEKQSEVVFAGLRQWLTSNLDWFFLLSGNIFVLVCLSVIILPWGSIRIGGRDATPDFSYLSWLAMLFAADMGIGLMFYGVAEPLGHYDAALAG